MDEMKNKDRENQPNGPEDELSGEDLLNKIEKDAQEGTGDGHKEESDLLGKIGLSKKERLKKENEELKHKLAEVNDKYVRLYAEFDNFRKRTLKERLELIRTAGVEVIQSLLPVLDDFKRAIRQMEDVQDPMTEGVKLIYQKLLSVLENRGLKTMTSLGEPFNPELHDAVAEVETADESKKGKVLDEIESGYYLNEKIIRHAKVVVGK